MVCSPVGVLTRGIVGCIRTMASLLHRKLLVLTGKGGVGKTTVSAALGLLAADRGLRTIVVEVGDQRRLGELFGLASESTGTEVALRKDLWSISIDPDRALLEWLQALGGRVSGRLLASSGTFQYFAAAAPGAKELVSMIKIWELTKDERGERKRTGAYDLVILDAPATGHAMGMLHSPQTFGAIARVGPIASQTQRVRELLSDPARTAYLAVAQPTEMAVTETIELQDSLRQQLDRSLHAVVLNGTLPRRFSAAEILQIDRLPEGDSVTRSATLAARAIHNRARFQHNQLARLRRRHFEVLPVPFLFTSELDLRAVEGIAHHLSRSL
jgi:anion-transporting  ArsA/GET3 family ATPase